MKTSVLGSIVLLIAAHGVAAAGPVSPYETAAPSAGVPLQHPVDSVVLPAMKKRGLEPALPCSDAVFVRRIHLDLTGTLPQPVAVQRFLDDGRPDKRTALIDALLASDDFAEYQAMLWCDVLRVKSEFPINLWPNAVQAYHRWIRDAIRRNLPYDQFARELLTSSGSNFRVPQVNFYRAVRDHQPATLAEAVALTFMGTRPPAWSEAQRANMATFFSRVAYKQTGEWKEEIVLPDPSPAGALDAVLPDGTRVRIPAGSDPRAVFADWLVAPTNPWFARCIVNRIWSRLLGRGIIHEPDDIRPDNPPAYPELLKLLERELVAHRYDLRHVYRVICTSGIYQQSCIPRTSRPDGEAAFACYGVRRLEAEVLIDALNDIFGGGEGYTSAVPEPFSYIPDRERSIALTDGSITSQFLEVFGRPARDTGLISERNNQTTDAQRLHLLNSTHIQRKIEGSWRLRELTRSTRGRTRGLVESLYLRILSRHPTPDEQAAAEEYFTGGGLRVDQAVNDLAWALVNSREFLYRH